MKIMKPTHLRLSTFAILCIIIALTNGCSDSTSKSGTESKSDAKERVYTVGMSQCNLGEPWRVQMNEDIRNAAAKHPHLKMVFKDAQNDTLKQRAHVEELVLFHLSARYEQADWAEMLREAREIFPNAHFPDGWNLELDAAPRAAPDPEGS